MRILALEFSSERRSVALVGVDGRVLAEADESGGRSTRALHLVDEVLERAGAGRDEVERIAVGIGPGSYTGIRAAISLAQGWELARGVKAVGVSSVAAMAERAFQDGVRGRFAIVVDAHRREYYLAGYEAGAGLRETESLKLVDRGEVEGRALAGELLMGPDAELFRHGARRMMPDAGTVGYLAVRSGRVVGSETLAPIYLREAGFVKAPPSRLFE